MKIVAVSAAIELITGVVIIVAPSVVGNLLLGTGFPGIARGVARLAGIALITLAIACWPRQRSGPGNANAVPALLAYNLLAAIYFCYWRAAYHSQGPLLWVAVAIHAAFTVLFLRAALRREPG